MVHLLLQPASASQRQHHGLDILLQQDWASAPLRDVISHSLEPHDPGGQIMREGHDLAIGSRSAVALSLMLHELATNAAKYGALSAADGRVRLSWTIDGDHLNLHWHETDGPPVTAPNAKGFGS